MNWTTVTVVMVLGVSAAGCFWLSMQGREFVSAPSVAPTATSIPRCLRWEFRDQSDNTGGVPSSVRDCTRATFTHSGRGNFIVWALDVEGDPVALLVNEIGDYLGTVRWDSFYRGLEVTADGAWSVVIE